MTRERNGRDPWPPELTEQLLRVDRLRRSGRYPEALARMRELVEVHPRQVRVRMELGLTLGVWGERPAEALPWFDGVLELAPGHASAQLHRALVLARLGRHAEAVAGFDALEAGGEFRKALVVYMRRAESLEVLGRQEDAERDWTRALGEDADNPWLLHQRALVRARLGRLEDAVADLTRALGLQEAGAVDAELLRDRGLVRARLGDRAGAQADFQAGRAALREGDPAALVESLHGESLEKA